MARIEKCVLADTGKKGVMTVEREKTAVRTLGLLLITLAVYLLLWQVLTALFDFPLYYYSRLVEFLALLLFAVLTAVTPMRFEEMGIVVPRRVLFRSLAAGGGVALLVFVGLFLLARGRADFAFSWHIRGDIARGTYFAVAPFHAVLGKSGMLYSFELVTGRRGAAATLLSALAFGVFHVVYGIKIMLLSMLLMLLTGFLFHRERCVWGCALAHFACGFFPACFGFG